MAHWESAIVVICRNVATIWPPGRFVVRPSGMFAHPRRPLIARAGCACCVGMSNFGPFTVIDGGVVLVGLCDPFRHRMMR